MLTTNLYQNLSFLALSKSCDNFYHITNNVHLTSTTVQLRHLCVHFNKIHICVYAFSVEKAYG